MLAFVGDVVCGADGFFGSCLLVMWFCVWCVEGFSELVFLVTICMCFIGVGTMIQKCVLILIKGLGLGGAEILFMVVVFYLDYQWFCYYVGYFLFWKDVLVELLVVVGLLVCCFGICWMVDLCVVLCV